MASYTPRYDASGLLTSYYSPPPAQQTTYTGQRKALLPVAGTSQSQAPGVAGQDDLNAWLRANIPGYGGSNPTSPVSPTASSNIGQLPSYSQLNNSYTQTIQPPPPITIPGAPELPAYTQPEAPAPAPLTPTDPRLDALTNKSLSNINSGLSGQLSPDVVQQITQRGAERGISVGSGSPNAGASILRALGLTSLDVQQAAEKNLQPYQERSAAVNLANIGQQGENYRAILDAAEAMRRLQLSEAGQMQRLSVQEQGDTQRAILAGQQALQQISAKGGTDIALALISANADQQRQILAGAQAMQQLQLSESGKIATLSAQLKAELQRTVIAGQQALAQIQAQGQNQLNNTALSGQYQLASGYQSGQNQLASERQAGTNAIDAILARYTLGGANALG